MFIRIFVNSLRLLFIGFFLFNPWSLKAYDVDQEAKENLFGSYVKISNEKMNVLLVKIKELDVHKGDSEFASLKENGFNFFERMVAFCVGKISLGVFDDLELQSNETKVERKPCFEHLKKLRLKYYNAIYDFRFKKLELSYEKEKEQLEKMKIEEKKLIDKFFGKLKRKKGRNV